MFTYRLIKFDPVFDELAPHYYACQHDISHILIYFKTRVYHRLGKRLRTNIGIRLDNERFRTIMEGVDDLPYHYTLYLDCAIAHTKLDYIKDAIYKLRAHSDLPY